MKVSIIKLERDDLSSVARAYMNKDDKAFIAADKITPVEGYEDFLIHGQPDRVEHQTTSGTWVEYSPEEFAEVLKRDPGYKGGNIRLLSCKSGLLDDGFAQRLSDIMNVKVLAPSEILWINNDGELFISDNPTLAEMWNNGEKVNPTGKWREFTPRGKEDADE